MRITMEHQGDDTQLKTSVEISDGSNIHDVIDSLCGLLVVYGFHPKSVEDGILSKAEELEENIKDGK